MALSQLVIHQAHLLKLTSIGFAPLAYLRFGVKYCLATLYASCLQSSLVKHSERNI